MTGSLVLTNVALLLVVATLWVEMKGTGRLLPMYRTWLSVAGIFALGGIVTTLLR
jgi:hypothetical protein